MAAHRTPKVKVRLSNLSASTPAELAAAIDAKLQAGRAQPHVTTREIPPLSLRALVSPSTLDEKKRTVDVTWTTGARVLRGFFDQFWEELSLDPKHVNLEPLNSGRQPLLDAHNAFALADVIGVVESARVEKGEGIATVRFARAEDDPAADAIFRKVADGIICNVSVGYRVNKMVKVEDAEEGDGKFPVFRAVDWTPLELSMVPIGADAGASVRSGSVATNPCEFVEEKKMAKVNKPQGADMQRAGTVTVHTDDDEITPDPEEDPPADGAAAADDAEAPEDDAADDERSASILTERKRITDITRVAKTLGVPELADEHINKGTSIAKFRAVAQTAYEKTQIETGGPLRIEAGQSSREKWLRGAESWILQRSGVAGAVAEHAKQRGETVRMDPGEFRGMRMLDLARQALERSGVRTAGMLPMELAGAALMQTGPALTQKQKRDLGAIGPGLQATGDFPILLENALRKNLLAQYATTPDTWSLFCATGTVTDFRPHKRYRMGSFSGLSTVNEGGEFPNKALPDAARESITAITKGNIVGISRQALVNDDLDAFGQISTALGRAARLTIEQDVYALLALNAGLGPTMGDTLTLFHATHLNIGVGSAISAAGIDADRVLMASQKDVSNNEILDLRPSVLLLPVGLGGVARQINNSQFDFDASNKFNIANRVLGLFQTIVDTPRITGTRRYLFASPTISPVIQVAFLDGQQQPFLDMITGWRIDGVEWKVRLDYAVGAIDFRGAVTNAGV